MPRQGLNQQSELLTVLRSDHTINCGVLRTEDNNPNKSLDHARPRQTSTSRSHLSQRSWRPNDTASRSALINLVTTVVLAHGMSYRVFSALCTVKRAQICTPCRHRASGNDFVSPWARSTVLL